MKTKEDESYEKYFKNINYISNIINVISDKEDEIREEYIEEVTEKEETEKTIEKKTEEIAERKPSEEILTFMKLLYNTMVENEVSDKYANELIDEINNNKYTVPEEFLIINLTQ